MVKSLRRSAAKARLFDSGRWHKWWAWYPVTTRAHELVLWEWVERRRDALALGKPLPVFKRSDEWDWT